MKLLLTALAFFLFCQITIAQSALNALQFDGADDHVVANLPALFNTISTNDFTIEVWVKPQGSVFSRIVYAQSSTTNFATISTGTDNSIYFYVVSNGTTYSIATANVLPLNAWTHVAVTWVAASNQIQVYFNGILQAGNAGGSSSTGSLNNLTIGARPGGPQYFNGTLDEIRIWSEARSACEILSNYQSQLMGTEPNLVAYYDFNAGVANGSNNMGVINLAESVSGNNGTLNNFALTGSTSNWTTSGATLITLGEMEDVIYSFQEEVCNGGEYVFNGQPLTASGIYTDTLVTMGGCDSIVELNLTILPLSISTSIVSECESYTWTNNTTYTNSGIYTDTLTNTNGCDSIIELNLTILPLSTSTTIVSECESYTWTNNATYTNSGIYTDTLTNTNGCDSIATLDLTILTPFETIEVAASCGPYTWPLNGQTYNFPGIFTDTLVSENGCDSIVQLNLTIHSIPTSNFVDNGDGTFTAVYSGFIQWIDCTTNAVVFGGQTFTPQQNGNYALVAADGAMCDDTSDCFVVDYLNIRSEDRLLLTISPNPTNDQVHISFSGSDAELTVYDLQGKVVLKDRIQNQGIVSLENFERGVYLFDFKNSQGHSVQRVVKQ